MNNVKEIVKDYLTKNGFDGLFSIRADCDCDLSRLFDCGDHPSDCVPGDKFYGKCGCSVYQMSPKGYKTCTICGEPVVTREVFEKAEKKRKINKALALLRENGFEWLPLGEDED